MTKVLISVFLEHDTSCRLENQQISQIYKIILCVLRDLCG